MAVKFSGAGLSQISTGEMLPHKGVQCISGAFGLILGGFIISSLKPFYNDQLLFVQSSPVHIHPSI